MTDTGKTYTYNVADKHKLYELKEIKVRLKPEDGESLLSNEIIDSPDAVIKLMQGYLDNLDREKLVVVNLDTQNRPLSYHVVSIGDVNRSLAPIQNMYKTAILNNATSIMLFHNHPSGSLVPSRTDDIITARAAYVGQVMGIHILDHVIVANSNDDFFSYKRNKSEILETPRIVLDKIESSDISEELPVYHAVRNNDMHANNSNVVASQIGLAEAENVKDIPRKKSVQEKVDEYRKLVADKFLKLLDADDSVHPMNWMKQWFSIDEPISMVTGKRYRGVNSLMLSLVAMEKGYKDPRWITFNGLNKFDNAKIKKGEKSSQIQYWMLSDLTKKYGEQKKFLTFQEAEKLIKEEGRDEKEFVLVARYSNVFNAEQCTGLPELIQKEYEKQINQNEYVTKISEKMHVPILNDGKGRAFYDRKSDTVHLPEKKAFFNEYAYNATALHELGHASGDEQRLNRVKGKSFGDEDYAFEELVAEMTSCFTASRLVGDEQSVDNYLKENAENHMRYVKSWAKEIKKNPKCLEDAVKLAQTATDFLDLHGGYLTLSEYNCRQKDNPIELVNNNFVMKNALQSSIVIEPINIDIQPEEQSKGMRI